MKINFLNQYYEKYSYYSKVESKYDENYLCVDNNWLFSLISFQKIQFEIAPFIQKPDLIILSGETNLYVKIQTKVIDIEII